MSFTLPELPYAYDALQPYMSAETLEFHHDKHHKAYVDKLNAAIGGGKYENMSLDDMVRESKGEPKVFNNAAQTWNHTFYWHCMSPNGGGEPGGASHGRSPSPAPHRVLEGSQRAALRGGTSRPGARPP